MSALRYLIVTCLFWLAACASQPEETTAQVGTETEEVYVEVASNTSLSFAAQPATTPLNVSILLFDGSGGSEPVNRIYEPIRDAEAAYFPVVLKRTLDDAGFWGAVSVVPTQDAASEVFVRGVIVESNALQMVLQVTVSDSRGVTWFERLYRSRAVLEEYDKEALLSRDPFQAIFNRVANDMAAYVSDLPQSAESALLDTAMLRYAILLSPEVFSDYLQQSEDGIVELTGLPARNDPLYRRVREIRKREFAVQDVVDQHFNNFFQDMRQVYPYWRQSSFELLAYNSELETKTEGRRRNSWTEVERVYRLYKERKLNEDELRELANSFEREIEPTVAELEGRVIELQGSLFDQYKTWRRLLREIYQETVGSDS